MSLAVNVEPRRSLLGRIRAWLRRRKTVLRAALTYPRPAADRWLPPVSTDSGGPWTCPAPPPPDPPDRSLPKRIGRFLIRKKLGEGGFGTVYLAYDPQLQRDVAVKVPRAESLSGRAIRRFLGDARAAARLRHPHIVPVFDAGFDGHVYYIASAYVNGGTLAAAIRSQAPFDSTRAARVARALADALAYAHSLGIIHRDIKPANVLLDAEGRPHLIDFGLARIVSSGEPDAAGSRAGTLHYRSPEQLCGEPVDGRSDQFSLGVVLYEMLCGRRPFAGQPDFLVDQDTVEKDPGPPSAHNPAVPADLEAICRKAMARRPEDHYADCRELADDLRRFLDGDFVAARQPGPAERLLRWCRRDPPLALAVTAVALSLAVAAVVAGTSAWRISAYAQSEAAARQDVEQERDRTAEALGRAIRSEKETKDALDQLRKKKEELEAVLQKLDGALTRVGQEKKRADEALVKVSDTLRQQEITSYFHRIALAERELRDGRLEQAETLLKECPEGLRGWEWYFLSARCGEQRRQHEGAVTCVALGGPKGKWLAWGTVTGAVVVRDLDKPRAGQRTLLRPEGKRAGAIRCLAFSPAMGKEEPELAAGDDSGRITVWKVERDGSPPTSFEAYRPPVSIRGVSFSLKGGYFATAGGQEVKVWKKDWWNPGWKPDPEYTLSHRGAVAWVGLHPLGNLVASGTSGKVFLWDRDNPGRPKVEYVSSTAGAFSPRGLDAALAMTGGAIRVYEPIRDRRGGYIEKCLYKGHNPHDVRSVVFSLGTRVASADAEGIVKVWDASSGGREFTTVRTAGGAFALSMDGQRLAWVGMDNCLHVLYVGVNTLPREKFAASGERLDARDGDPTLAQYADYTSAVALSRDGLLATASIIASKDRPTERAGEVRIWDRAGNRLHSFSLPRPAWYVAWSADGQHLAAAVGDGEVWIAKGEKVCRLSAHNGDANAVVFHPKNSDLLASVGDDGVRVWNTQTGKLAPGSENINHKGAVNCVAWSHDGRLLATGGEDGTVRLWAWNDRGGLVRAFGPHKGSVRSVAFSPDDKYLAATDEAGTVTVWDIKDKNGPYRQMKGHNGRALAVAFSPDGRRLASAGADRAVKLWDWQSARDHPEALSLQGPSSFGFTLTFSADGRRLFASSEGVQVWEAQDLRAPPAAP